MQGAVTGFTSVVPSYSCADFSDSILHLSICAPHLLARDIGRKPKICKTNYNSSIQRIPHEPMLFCEVIIVQGLALCLKSSNSGIKMLTLQNKWVDRWLIWNKICTLKVHRMLDLAWPGQSITVGNPSGKSGWGRGTIVRKVTCFQGSEESGQNAPGRTCLSGRMYVPDTSICFSGRLLLGLEL